MKSKTKLDACYQPPKYLVCDTIWNATISIWLDIISELSMWGILMEPIIVQYKLYVQCSSCMHAHIVYAFSVFCFGPHIKRLPFPFILISFVLLFSYESMTLGPRWIDCSSHLLVLPLNQLLRM